jgi:transposase InsO family protein
MITRPMSSASLMGIIYYVSFIDDASRKKRIYFMKTMDEVFSMYQEFIALVDNYIGKKMKVLRSNNGREYTSKEFDSFCIEAEIKRELTMPYNQQQNGVAKRKYGSIVEIAKAMVQPRSSYIPLGKGMQYKCLHPKQVSS